MKSKTLYSLAKELFLPTLKLKGFLENNGRFTRILDSGVVHIIGFGKDPHGAETFRVLIGLNATCFATKDHPYGYIKYEDYCDLTKRGWDYNSGRWACETEEDARESLTAVWQLLHNLGIPWLDTHTTLSSVGDEISEVGSPGLGWMKARLYMLDGDLPRAREAIERYAAWATKPRNWGTNENQQEDISRAEQLRQEVEAAASGSGD